LVHRLCWVKASVPLAGLNGSITGTNIQGSSTGTGDSGYKVAVLLKGGPALSAAQFANYKPTTTVGMSLAITAPTGQYNPNSFSTLVQIVGRSSRKSQSRIHSGRNRSGRSKATPTRVSSRTTLLIVE